MGSLEIGESSNNIQVGLGIFINDEDGRDLRSAQIFRVSKQLLDRNEHFYIPHLISIGPFYYGKPELSGMEQYKSEAVRRMQTRIQNRDPRVTIKSVVEEEIMKKDKDIRDFYGEHISLSAIELAWMVTRDACFILEFIITYIQGIKEAHSVYEQMKFSSSKYDPIFDVYFQNPTRDRLMDDILLFENQVPLFILKYLLEFQMGSGDAANEKLVAIMVYLVRGTTRQRVFEWVVANPWHECSHVLQILYQGMVGKHLNNYGLEARRLFPPSSTCVPFCLSYKNGGDRMKANFSPIFASWCKPCSNWMKSLHSTSGITSCSVGEVIFFVKLPSAVKLNNAGIKLHPVLFDDLDKESENGHPPIQWIRFDEKISTLYLPQVIVTTQSESLMRNIIAMEVSSSSRNVSRPMVQFAKLMDELLDGEEDVAVLREAGIIKNHMGSNQEVAHVFNSLSKEIIYSLGCKPIDDVRMGLHNYTKRKYKILWSEFVSAYFSKPWLVAGSIAAMLLLLMTVLQVFCLFYMCGA